MISTCITLTTLAVSMIAAVVQTIRLRESRELCRVRLNLVEDLNDTLTKAGAKIALLNSKVADLRRQLDNTPVCVGERVTIKNHKTRYNVVALGEGGKAYIIHDDGRIFENNRANLRRVNNYDTNF